MAKKEQLQEILRKLNTLQQGIPTDDITGVTNDLIENEILNITSRLKENPTIRTLSKFTNELNKFKRDFDLKSIIDSIKSLQREVKQSEESLLAEFEARIRSIPKTDIQPSLSALRVEFESKLSNLPQVDDLWAQVELLAQQLQDIVSSNIEEEKREKSDLDRKLAELKAEFESRMANIGGGAINREIRVNSSVMSLKYTDINFKNGGNIGWSASNDETNKRVNITASILLGGGGGSGTPSIGGGITGGRDMDILFVHPASILAQDDSFRWDSVNKNLRVGTDTNFSGTANAPVTVGGSINSFLEVTVQNTSTGDTASGDFIVSADNDTLGYAGHYVDMGIEGSGFVGTPTALGIVKSVSVSAAGSGYTVGDVLTIIAGDSNATVTVATLSGNGVATVALGSSGSNYSIAGGLSTSGGTGSGAQMNVLSLFDFTGFLADDGYLYTAGGNMVIGTDDTVPNTFIRFLAGGTGLGNEVARITPSVLQLGVTGSVFGKAQFKGKTSGTVGLTTASVAGTYTLVLPPNTGTANQVLTTDGNGITTWTTAGASSVAAGITRVTSIITANTTGGSTTLTDYVFIATAGMSFTLPDASGNGNLYTLKNASNSSVLVTAIGGDTIDGSGSVLTAINNQSLDFISDGTNYRII